MRIWEYEFAGQSAIWNMPSGAEVLCVQLQAGKPCLWVKVDPDATLQARYFQLHFTGIEMGPGEFKYIGTFQMASEFGMPLVWHVFEVMPVWLDATESVHKKP